MICYDLQQVIAYYQNSTPMADFRSTRYDSVLHHFITIKMGKCVTSTVPETCTIEQHLICSGTSAWFFPLICPCVCLFIVGKVCLFIVAICNTDTIKQCVA